MRRHSRGSFGAILSVLLKLLERDNERLVEINVHFLDILKCIKIFPSWCSNWAIDLEGTASRGSCQSTFFQPLGLQASI